MAEEKKKKAAKKEKEFTFDAKKIPTDPGCYLYYGEGDDILYVGKAKNLRKRVSSYFQKEHENPRLQVLVRKIQRIETRIVQSEIEALVLENNLIKQHMPRYNVLLRDDKNFVYLRITKEEKPKMEIVRRLVKDGSTYIGPRTATKEFKKVVRFCQKHFRVQMVKESQNYYPHLQAGLLEQDAETYKKNIALMKQFLQGKTDEVLKDLHEKMMKFAAEKNFEAAAKTRDLIQSIDIATQKINVEFTDMVDRDCIHLYRDGSRAYMVRLAFRYGKLLHQNEVEIKAPQNQTDKEVIEQFIVQFYQHVVDPPKEIFVPVEIEDSEAVTQYLSDTYFEGATIKIIVPQIGDKKRVLDIAEANAKNFAEKQRIEDLSSSENFSKALPELAEALDLKESPKRMECFDISHFGGRDTVASMVVFVDGKPDNSQYKRFKIKTLPDGKIDDFASMEEVLQRRFARAKAQESEKPKKKKKSEEKKGEKKEEKKEKWPLPDLIIIDGGKGQLSSVMKVAPKGVNIISLAKREEEVFLPGKKEPIILGLDSAALKLLQRIRDEAHRFAITHNRAIRKKAVVKSVLDDVEGIGPTTKKKLLTTFGSVKSIREAADTELLKVVSQKQLDNLRHQL